MTNAELKERAKQRLLSKANNTERMYQLVIDHWCEAIGDKLLDPTLGEAQAVWDQIASGWSPETSYAYCHAVKWFYAELRDMRATRNGVVENLEVPFPQRNEKPTYPERDLEKIIVAAEPIDECVILFHTDCGMRVHDILQLSWSNVRENHAVIVDGQKVPLSPRLDATLHKLPRKQGRILPYGTQERARQRIRAVCKKAGVKYRGLDVLRRYYT